VIHLERVHFFLEHFAELRDGHALIFGVDGAPAGIDCLPGCRTAFGDYTTNTTVRLRAAEDGDSKFLGWSGGCTTTALWCDVLLSQSKTVTANFAAVYKLIVNKDGTGSGTVTSNPSGIDCDASCLSASASFLAGSTVTLEAHEATGSTFIQWGGACSGASCQVLMDAAKTVTATFTGPPAPTSSWAPTSTTGAPAGRANHTAVSTGSLMIVWALAPFAFAGFSAVMPLHTGARFGWREKELGLAFTVIGVVAAIVQGWAFGRLARRFGHFRVGKRGRN